MTTTISDGTTSVTPKLILEYEHTRATRSLVHDVLGRADPDVTLRAAATRSGRIRALLVSPADVSTLDELLSAPAVLSIASTDEPRLDGLTFVVADADIRVTLEGQSTWFVEWTYQQVAP